MTVSPTASSASARPRWPSSAPAGTKALFAPPASSSSPAPPEMRYPGPKLNIPPSLFCMSWCPDFGFRGTCSTSMLSPSTYRVVNHEEDSRAGRGPTSSPRSSALNWLLTSSQAVLA